ncbi:MAG: hypothetical protein ABSG12_15290 [Steroidobacteraceae bacterium]
MNVIKIMIMAIVIATSMSMSMMKIMVTTITHRTNTLRIMATVMGIATRAAQWSVVMRLLSAPRSILDS